MDLRKTGNPVNGLNMNTSYSSARGNFIVKISITYKQFIDFVDTEDTRNFVTTPIIQHIINNVITQFWRIPEQMQTSFYCMGKEIIRLHLDNAYQPLEVDLLGKLFEGLSVRVKAGITGKPYINLGLIHRILLTFDLPLIQFYALSRGERMFSEEELNRLSRKEISFNRNQVLMSKQLITPVRHYTIDSFADGSANSTRFEIDGSLSTVREYYASKYNINLRFPDLQLIKMRGREVYIPVELLNISMRPQKVHTQLSPGTLRAICQKATNDPRAYFDKVTRMSQLALLNDTLVQREFGVEIPVEWSNDRARLEPMEIKGRILPTPNCRYEESRPLDRRVLEPAQQAYLIACTVNLRSSAIASDFVHELLNVSYRMNQRFINEQNVQYKSAKCPMLNIEILTDIVTIFYFYLFLEATRIMCTVG
ncbi:Protein argonaute-2 [Aphelenchoides bicaudatus]|nr:Protein argonaute-2 [Aphelenchoides bicaudatus]